MPFVSKAQQRKMFSLQSQGKLKPGTAKEWASHTDFSHLPEKLHERAHIEELKKKRKK